MWKINILIVLMVIASSLGAPQDVISTTTTTTTTPTTTTEIADSEEEGVDGCWTEKQCPPFHQCVQSIFFDNYCSSNFRKLSESSGAEIEEGGCLIEDNDGNKIPDHELCIDGDYSINRCFPGQFNYTCSRAYLMPCTPTYDIFESGDLITTELIREDDCPQGFSCSETTFENDGKFKVCQPDIYAIDDGSTMTIPCETPIDCGYSTLQGNWAKCSSNGYCAFVIS